MLWRHECSRYASSSRIGYHPNHPSSSRPSSRPSSAATILRPFSAGRVPQRSQQHKRRASSARPSRLSSPGVGAAVDEAGLATGTADERGGGSRTTRTRPRSAIPRLGVDVEEDADNADGRRMDSRSRRGVSASAAMKDGDDASREGNNATRATRSKSARSRSPAMRKPDEVSHEEEGDEVFDDIYEDLDEDDDELDNRISIMESRFSTVGRERPGSAVEDGVAGTQHRRRSGPRRIAANAAPRAAMTQRPPRAPPQERRQLSAGPRPPSRQLEALTGGELKDDVTGKTGDKHPVPSSTGIYGAQAPLVIRSRPTSAPVDGGSSIYRYQQDGDGGAVRDPMAPLHARRLRLQMSSAGAAESRSQVGRDGAWTARDEHQHQQRTHSVRDVRKEATRSCLQRA